MKIDISLEQNTGVGADILSPESAAKKAFESKDVQINPAANKCEIDSAEAGKKTTYWDSVFHLYIVSAGPTLLSLPKGFMKAGYVNGSLVVLLVLLYYWYATRMLVRVERTLCQLKKRPHLTYSETMYYALDEGPPAVRWLAPLSSNLLRFMYVITWLDVFSVVLITQNLQNLALAAFGVSLSIHQAAIYAFVPLLALNLVRRLRYLAPISMLGNCIVLVCIASIVYFVLEDTANLRMPPAFGSLTELPICLAGILYAVNATGLMLPLKNEMAEPKKFYSGCSVLNVSYFPMIVVFVVFNVLCCMKYGDQLRDTVIENLPSDSVFARCLGFLFTLALCFEMPLVTYVAFDTIWNNILLEKRKNLSNALFWEYLTRMMVFLASFCAAFVIPNINVFMAIGGTVGSAVDTMIYPAVAETLVMRRVGCKGFEMTAYCFKNACIVVLAVIITIIGMSSCTYELMQTFES